MQRVKVLLAKEISIDIRRAPKLLVNTGKQLPDRVIYGITGANKLVVTVAKSKSQTRGPPLVENSRNSCFRADNIGSAPTLTASQ